MNLDRELDTLLPGCVRPAAPMRDVAGYDLGCPLVVVSPDTTEKVCQLVLWARSAGVAVVPVGRRTAYWRPLDVNGAVAVEFNRMTNFQVDDGVLSAQGGALIRTVDGGLRQQGLALPLVPDAYGDSTIGALVATGCTSGLGMGNGTITRALTSLTVVTGTGEIVRTGTAATLGLAPFLRDGLPDSTLCFVGSEGCLGLITEVHMRLRPPPYRVLLRFSVPSAAAPDILHLGERLGPMGVFDTFRATRVDSSDWNVDLFIQSHVDAAEARRRARGVALAVHRRFGEPPAMIAESSDARAGHGSDYEALWSGPAGGHEEFSRSRRLVGIDAVTTYGDGPQLVSQMATMSRRCPAMQRRLAMYLAPDYVQIGLHLTCAVNDHRAEREIRSLFSELHDVVPYRFGHCWPVEGVDRTELLRLKRVFDPDYVLNPNYPLFMSPGPPGPVAPAPG